jgi:hypothetical protein
VANRWETSEWRTDLPHIGAAQPEGTMKSTRSQAVASLGRSLRTWLGRMGICRVAVLTLTIKSNATRDRDIAGPDGLNIINRSEGEVSCCVISRGETHTVPSGRIHKQVGSDYC